jgi:hypothetical protein
MQNTIPIYTVNSVRALHKFMRNEAKQHETVIWIDTIVENPYYRKPLTDIETAYLLQKLDEMGKALISDAAI